MQKLHINVNLSFSILIRSILHYSVIQLFLVFTMQKEKWHLFLGVKYVMLNLKLSCRMDFCRFVPRERITTK